MCISSKVFSIAKIFKDVYLDWLQTSPDICLLKFLNILSSQDVFGSQWNTADTFCLNQTQKSQKLHDKSLNCDRYQVMVGTLFQQLPAFPVIPTTMAQSPMIFSEAMRRWLLCYVWFLKKLQHLYLLKKEKLQGFIGANIIWDISFQSFLICRCCLRKWEEQFLLPLFCWWGLSSVLTPKAVLLLMLFAEMAT